VTEASERQVLYTIVAAGFFVVAAVLSVAAAWVGISPRWWSIGFGVAWLAAVITGFRTWRRTGRLLVLALAVFVLWAVGALMTR
jgi:purine-cytosine permease-like protein